MTDDVTSVAERSSQLATASPDGLVAALRRFDPGSPRDLARAALGLLALVVLGGLLVRYGTYSATILQYPFEWDEDEGLAVYFAQRLAAGEPIYVDFNRLPMLSACYPPVYPYAVSLALPAFGVTLAAGRVVSLLAMAGVCGLILVAVRQETHRWSLGMLAGAMVFGSPYVLTFTPLARADSVAVFLVLAGVVVIRQFPRFRVAVPLGLLFLVAACCTKYQAVLLTPAVFWYLWRHSRRVALGSAVAFAAAGIAVLVYLMHASGGEFWRSTMTAQATEYGWGFFTERTHAFLGQHALLVAGAIGLLVVQISRRDLSIWGALFLSSVLIILLAGKQGAAINYFIPAIVAATIGSVIAIDALLRNVPRAWSTGAMALVLLVVTLQGVIFWLYPIRRPTADDRAACEKILALVEATEGDVLTERRVMFSLLAGRQPQIDACTLYFAYQVGREQGAAVTRGSGSGDAAPRKDEAVCWDPAELIKAIQQKRFPLIVLGLEFFPSEVLQAVSLHYRQLDKQRVRIGNWHGENQYFLMVPR